MLNLWCALLLLSASSLLGADLVPDHILIPLEDIHGQQSKHLAAGDISEVVRSLFGEATLLQVGNASARQLQILYASGHPVLRTMNVQQAHALGLAFRDRLVQHPDAEPSQFQTALSLAVVGQIPVVRREKLVGPDPLAPQYRKFEHDPIFREVQPGTPILIGLWYLVGVMSPNVDAAWYKFPVVATGLVFAGRTAPYVVDGVVNSARWLMYRVKLLRNYIAKNYDRKTTLPTPGTIVLESFYKSLSDELKQNKFHCALVLTKPIGLL